MSTIIWKSTGRESKGKELGDSLWNYKEKDEEIYYKRKLPPNDNILVDILIIGGGIAGILIGYMLISQGKSVVIVDKDKIGGGATSKTTAKISSQHDLIYNKLINKNGEEVAKAYAMINEKAIRKYEEIIQQNNIQCDFEKLPSYIYTLDDELKIKKEVEAVQKLGLKASFEKEIELPLKIKGAIKLENQGQFHPLKFIQAVSKNMIIYEDTSIKEIRNDGLVITDRSNIKANNVVIASHYPFINRTGYYFLKMHQERFYVGALRNWNKTGERLKGMYLDADPNGFSFRDYKDMILVGTGSHRTGQENPVDGYKRIRQAKERWYTDAHIEYMWSNQDCMTPDSIPYIGTYSASLPNFYVATGFNKWGMTSSMVAAMLISDMILGKENSYQKVFDPKRLMVLSTHKIVADTAITTINFISETLKIAKDKLSKIERGKAGIINYKGDKLGVYRDDNDKYYYVKTKCPHLGCSLSWNQNELTWDCPCHGSRFDYHGKLINNPATRNLDFLKKEK